MVTVSSAAIAIQQLISDLLAAARAAARRRNVGWVIVWHSSPDVLRYLANTGFHLAYAADGALVYRLAPT